MRSFFMREPLPDSICGFSDLKDEALIDLRRDINTPLPEIIDPD
jgi:hypothetical protein